MSEELKPPSESGAALPLLLKGKGVLTISQRCWRILAPKWAHDPLSGEGASRFGGRFNPKGVSALYLSESIDTAFAEYQQDLLVRPGTFCAYQLDVSGIVDLCNAQVCQAVSVDQASVRNAIRGFYGVRRRMGTNRQVA